MASEGGIGASTVSSSSTGSIGEAVIVPAGELVTLSTPFRLE
jgi:hypothetical protein